MFEPKAGTVRLTETLVVYLLLVCLLVTWLSFYRGFSRDYIDIPYLCQDSVACLCHLHSLHNPRSRPALPPQSLAFLSCVTTQPPWTKVLVGHCDCKFKIGDNPGLKLPLWPEFFNLMQ